MRIGTTCLSSSTTPEMGRTGASGPTGFGPSQSGRAAGREDHRRRGPTLPPGVLVWIGPENLGIGSLLDAVVMGDPLQRIATGKKVPLKLAGSHARLSVHTPGII